MTPAEPDHDALALAAARTPSTTPGWVPPAPAELDALLPQLTVEALIARGGMGAVYRARQRSLDRMVALKVLPPVTGRESALGARFAREARALARLNHPSIITVHDHGESGGMPWLVTELVDGANLRQVLATGPLSPDTALRLIARLCDAIQYAHDLGVVHRDLKPENVLIDARGWPKIADFGLAKLGGGGADLTHSGEILGTYRYMAPEQIAGGPRVDHRADIYALGVLLYETLTGAVPMGRFDPPSRTVAVDARVDEAVLRALEREPERRWQRAADLGRALEAVVSTAATGAATAAPPTAASTPSRAWRLHDLRRSSSERMLAGVCGGLGAASPLPAWAWRVLFLGTALAWGAGIIGYLVFWIAVPGPLVSVQFRRSSTERMLAGVCGGLGAVTALPAWAWRVLFMGTAIAWGAGIAAYLVLWVAVPRSPAAVAVAATPPRSRRWIWWLAFALLALSALALIALIVIHARSEGDRSKVILRMGGDHQRGVDWSSSVPESF